MKLFSAILLLPVIAITAIYAVSPLDVVINAGIAVLLAFLMVSCKNLKYKPLALNLLIAVYLVFVFFTLFESVLYDFTGRGFTDEVFFHFELESVRIAFKEYPLILFGFLGFSAVFVILAHLLVNRSVYHPPRYAFWPALLLLLFLIPQSTLGRLSQSLQEFLDSAPVQVSPENIQNFMQAGVINDINLTTKFKLQSIASAQPKNLILLYLESFNRGLLQLPDYPGLTPNLNRMNQDFTSLDLLSSAYVTIEGIISSQCGTMLPMDAGNNTFLSNGQLMKSLPCLGDVLKKAGYQQYYLGGAVMEFAGKGRFFETHGYDYIKGWEHWQEAGYKQEKGVWGLSDAALFEEAVKTIKEASSNPPYNVTLLTLGTHLPGYIYAGCEKYADSADPFINAIHCTDKLVGDFVSRLEAENLLEDTVLMVVADHGVFPTPKMTELFGSEVENRKLLAFTNQPLNQQNKTLAGYDLAPTILDLLDIQHNVQFFYGKSLFDKSKDTQRYVTRFLDWKDHQLASNPSGECAANNPESWPMNQCMKKQLISLTNQVLARYSEKELAAPLGCELEVEFQTAQKSSKQSASLKINGDEHLTYFYNQGYLLNPAKVKAGIWVLELSDDNSIISHQYFTDTTPHQTLNTLFTAESKRYLFLLKSANTDFLKNLGIESIPESALSFYKRKMQTDTPVDWSQKKSFSICH